MNNYFLDTNYRLISPLCQELIELYQNCNFYVSKGKFTRSDIEGQLRDQLQKIFKFNFDDCGFLLTRPNQTYHLHKDNTRISAINILLSEPNIEFKTFFKTKNTDLMVNYRKNFITLFNVQEFHSVINSSSNYNRIVISIGFKNISYKDLVSSFLNKDLFENFTLIVEG